MPSGMSKVKYKYLVMQIEEGNLTLEEVQEKYPGFEMPE